MLKYKTKIISLVAAIFFFSINDYCLARAGGGGGAGDVVDGGIFTTILIFILTPFLIAYSIIVSIKLKNKQIKVKDLTAQLAKADKIWDYRNMMSSVEQIFFKVQDAWMQRNQDLAKEVMSDRIYQKHKLQTDEMIANGTKNMLAKINMEEIMIISVSDYKDNSEDTFSAYIKGSMIDYTIDDKNNAVISGSNAKTEEFKEIWTFIRNNNKWVLDEIDQNVTLGDINNSKAFTERIRLS